MPLAQAVRTEATCSACALVVLASLHSHAGWVGCGSLTSDFRYLWLTGAIVWKEVSGINVFNNFGRTLLVWHRVVVFDL